MKPNQLELRVDPHTGRIIAVHVQRGKPIKRIKDITDEVLLCLCADLSANEDAKEIARSIKFNDGMSCEIFVKLITPPDPETRERLDREYNEGVGNGVEVMA